MPRFMSFFVVIVCLSLHAQGETIEEIEERLRVRASLIEQYPSDPYRPIWLTDQAADLYFSLFHFEGTELSTLFGLPSESQRDRAIFVAREMYECAEEAATSLATIIAALKQSTAESNDPTSRDSYRDAIEIDHKRRIPFLRGIGAYLHATINQHDASRREQLLSRSAHLLSSMILTLDGEPSDRARLYATLAFTELGRYDQAKPLIDDLMNSYAASQSDRFAARIAHFRLQLRMNELKDGRQALDEIERQYSDPNDIFYRLLIADQKFFLHQTNAVTSTGPDRVSERTRSIEAYTDLLIQDLGISRDDVLAIVFSRLVLAADMDGSLDDLPPIVSIAVADHLSRDSTTRERAIIILENELATERAGEFERAIGLFALGRALYEHNQPVLAARRFIELAHQHATDRMAERAIELGVGIAFETHRSRLNDAEVRSILTEGLQLLLTRYPNLSSINTWRYAAAQLAIGEERYDDALNLLAQITPDAVEYFDSLFQRVEASKAKWPRATNPDTMREFARESLSVLNDVEPRLRSRLNQMEDDHTGLNIRSQLASLKMTRAEAMIYLGQWQEAVNSLAGIENDPSVPDQILSDALSIKLRIYESTDERIDVRNEVRNFMSAVVDRTDAVLQPILESRRQKIIALQSESRDDEATALAQSSLLPVAEILDEWLSAPTTKTAVSIHSGLLIADAYRLSGELENGLVWYDRMLEHNPDAVELLFGRAECLFHLGETNQLGEAMMIYKRIAAFSEPGGKDYWRSHLRMLEALDRSERRTEQILPRIEQLRQRDPMLGGEPFRAGFESLRTKYVAAVP